MTWKAHSVLALVTLCALISMPELFNFPPLVESKGMYIPLCTGDAFLLIFSLALQCQVFHKTQRDAGSVYKDTLL